MRFLEHNSKSIRSIDLKLSTDTHCGLGKISIYFGNTGVIFRVKWSVLGSLEHKSKSFKAINLNPGTDSCLWSGKMSIHFGVTDCTKVYISPMGVSCPALWRYICQITKRCSCRGGGTSCEAPASLSYI